MKLFLLFALCACTAAHAGVPVILDTDLGDDIDDTWALCQALGDPAIDLRLIVTASDNTPAKTRLVAKMLERLGRTEIPLGTGKQTSEKDLHQAAWLGDYLLDDYPGTVHEDGVQALIDAVHAGPGDIIICVIGPQTNLGEALKRDPSIADKARIVSMAGSVHVGYEGAPEPMREWNVFRDVDAIQAVFAAPWEITIAPLDICGTLRLSGERYEKVAASENPRAQVVIENYNAWTNRAHHPADASSILFDTVAIHLCHDEDWVKMETVPLRIDAEGNTVVDKEKGRPVRCALDWKDREAFEKHLVKTLTVTKE